MIEVVVNRLFKVFSKQDFLNVCVKEVAKNSTLCTLELTSDICTFLGSCLYNEKQSFQSIKMEINY